MMDGAPVAEEAMAGGSVGSSSSPAVRKYFPETWIWDCFDSGFVSTSLNSIIVMFRVVCF